MSIIDYKRVILEEVEDLKKIERQQKEGRLRDRVRFIRYLKEGKATSQPQAGEMVGLKRRRSQQLWQQYQQDGLSALLRTHYKGSWAKLNSQQQARLLQRLDQDDVFTQQQIIDWLQAEMGVTYTQGGLSDLLARLKIKAKTGRPVNVRKDEAGEQAFKKTLRL